LGRDVSAREIVELASKTNCRSVAYTYNEPAIFVEFVKDIAVLARKNGMKNILVTNGYFSKESSEFIFDLIDAMNIDLKSFSEKTYKKYCRARLKPVLENIKLAYDKGIHIEITTLVVPGVNDSSEELEKIAKFIAKIDKNIPWHVSRFFPMFKMTKKKPTPIETLKRAYKIGKKYLNYVYLGNIG
jgi:pyruvate formate lyase activating enzyme